MTMFFYDKTVCFYEKKYEWDNSLLYLEKIYHNNHQLSVLYSLVGNAWLYHYEGPIISKEYEADKNCLGLTLWEKYIKIGLVEAKDDPFFCFLVGYTLSLHGIDICETHEIIGHCLMRKCAQISNSPLLQQMADNFLLNEHSKHYMPLKNATLICEYYFNGSSLLDEYFRNMYMYQHKVQ